MVVLEVKEEGLLTIGPGDADGLGDTRKKELIKSGMQLGLRDEDDVFVVDNPYIFSFKLLPSSSDTDSIPALVRTSPTP
jgi:N-acetylglucosaminylphosphatidylinositol deacetylase